MIVEKENQQNKVNKNLVFLYIIFIERKIKLN